VYAKKLAKHIHSKMSRIWPEAEIYVEIEIKPGSDPYRGWYVSATGPDAREVEYELEQYLLRDWEDKVFSSM